jgi:hypothetical protein
MEARLLHNGPELENSVVRIVATGLEYLSEQNSTRGAATERRFADFSFGVPSTSSAGLHLARSGVPANTARQQGDTPWRGT